MAGVSVYLKVMVLLSTTCEKKIILFLPNHKVTCAIGHLENNGKLAGQQFLSCLINSNYLFCISGYRMIS